MIVRVVDDKYVLTFPYDMDTINQVKSVGNARWNAKEKCWSIPRNQLTALKLKSLRWHEDTELLAMVPQRGGLGGQYTWEIKKDLFKHQVEWREWCRQVPRAFLDGDPGVGKTLMTMLWWQAHGMTPQDILVVCPASLLYNWQHEIRDCTGHEAAIISGTKKQVEAALKHSGVHVVNYERLFGKDGKLRPELAALNKRVLVCDESHRLRNPGTLASKLTWHLGRDMDAVLLLTGTPVSQGPQDFFAQFRVVNDKVLGPGFSAFKTEFCQVSQVYGAPAGVTRICGYRNLDRLMAMIKPYMYSIRKDTCLDLPPKTYETIHVELSTAQQRAYHQLKTEFVTDVGQQVITAQNILPRLNKLQQVCQGFILGEDGKVERFKDNPKIDAVETLLRQDDKPCVIMCKYREDATLLEEMCVRNKWISCTINGAVDKKDRDERVRNFEAGNIRILIGQIQSAGTGINLVASDRTIFYCNDYSLVLRKQAEDRIHRIGARGDYCHYIDIVARGTVDENVAAALARKQDLASMLNNMDVTTLV